jgi:hypothetical protein
VFAWVLGFSLRFFMLCSCNFYCVFITFSAVCNAVYFVSACVRFLARRRDRDLAIFCQFSWFSSIYFMYVFMFISGWSSDLSVSQIHSIVLSKNMIYCDREISFSN